ncbi:MAG: GvpL/GvpF family gas vesicle protein, partial [Candidatus Dormibacteraeota bacterium]|nr:GvpL/GvpF family gas vesicle protein [Candidatus Dormibacteraeota bacterium]
ETGCYLFAIARAGGAPLPSIQGMDGSAAVREVVSGELAGVVCEIPLSLFDGLDQEPVGPESRLAELARRHDQVVRTTFERRTVLPLRFGTVLTSEAQVVDVLGKRQEQLLGELRHLEGKAEWTCRIEPDPAGATATRPDPAPIGGAAYLAERERELAATAEKDDPYGVTEAAERVLRAVEAHVESALPPDPAGEEARVTFLVPDEGQERFAEAVATVAGASPALRIELLGPHPPYHFATVQLGGEGQ